MIGKIQQLIMSMNHTSVRMNVRTKKVHKITTYLIRLDLNAIFDIDTYTFCVCILFPFFLDKVSTVPESTRRRGATPTNNENAILNIFSSSSTKRKWSRFVNYVPNLIIILTE